MKSIRIGSVILSNRKRMGLTQEELASYLGISKPAVSKWESGQSYPDITLLPEIASYFNLSVDDLLGYTPQMDRKTIQDTYEKLSERFSKSPYDQVMAECDGLIRKYYSCWDFLFAMGTLLINHAPLAHAPNCTQETYAKALSLFTRVEDESGDTILARQSLEMQAFCHCAMGSPNLAIDLLENISEAPVSPKLLLAKAYSMKGDAKKAVGLLQSYLYACLIGAFGAAPDLLMLYAQDSGKLDQCVRFMDALAEAVETESLHPWVLMPILLVEARLYALSGRRDEALARLERYAKLITSPGLFPIKLRGNAFFDADSLFCSSVMGAQPPRNDELVKQDMKKTVLEDPAYEPFHSDERFISIATIIASI